MAGNQDVDGELTISLVKHWDLLQDTVKLQGILTDVLRREVWKLGMNDTAATCKTLTEHAGQTNKDLMDTYVEMMNLARTARRVDLKP